MCVGGEKAEAAFGRVRGRRVGRHGRGDGWAE